MELLVASDTTSLSYWLNWRFFLCALWVVIPMSIAAYIIWKYEYTSYSKPDSEGTEQEGAWFSYVDDAWRPCVKEIHPICLMTFRIVAFFSSLIALIVDVVVQGGSLFLYYTQWTFALVTVYFGVGSLLSIYGCLQHHKSCGKYNVYHDVADAERESYVSLISGGAVDEVRVKKFPEYQGIYYVFRTFLGWSHVFQIMFQMTAGAVILTDFVYWCIIYPFLTAKDYKLRPLTVIEHSLNAILLLGDTALNGLRFSWFRISYFILLTGIYVIFQWSVHASVSIWWPYPILDLSSPYAPLWYLVVLFLHFPCYTLFGFVIKSKYYMVAKWFPQSYQSLR